jgi:ATP-binding cassette subfamily B protein
MPIMGNMSYITYAATATIGSLLIMTVPEEHFFGISVGALFTFLIYTRQFFQPITQISQQFNNIIAALAGAERIFEIIDTPAEEDDGYVTLVNAKKNPDGSISECTERTGIWAWKHPHSDGTLTYTEWRATFVSTMSHSAMTARRMFSRMFRFTQCPVRKSLL